MRISFILDSFGGGGKERRCLQLIQGLSKSGYNDIQVIIVNNDIAYQELYEANIEMHIIDRKNKKLNFFKTYSILNNLIKKHNPDIVQVWGLLGAFYVNIIKCFNNFKYIGAYVADCNQARLFSISKLTIALNIYLADCIVGNSKAGLKAYGIPQKKARVIYNGFNENRYISDKYSSLELKKNVEINTKYAVSMVARVDPFKDQKTFIEAAKLILKERKDITFLIVGKGPNLNNLRENVDELESEYIHFLGFRTDVEEILKASDVSVLCSNPNRHKEGVSNAILESFAFGTPVIATNDGGTPEIVDSGVNGFLIKEFDVADLKAKILRIIDDEKLKANLSSSAKQIVKNKFTLKFMTNSYISLYKEIL